MSRIADMIRACVDEPIACPGGGQWVSDLQEPLDRERLEEYERWLEVTLPRDFRDLLLESNGAAIYGSCILAVPRAFRETGRSAWYEDQLYYREHRLLRMFTWGYERDFDCIALDGSAYPTGSIVFVIGEPERAVCYQPNMEVWLRSLIANARRDRAVLHPREYAQHGLKLDECVAGEVVRTAVEQGWDIYSTDGDTLNDPAELRRLAEEAVAAQPRRRPYDMMNLAPTIIARATEAELSRKPKRNSALSKLVRSWDGLEVADEDEDTHVVKLRPGVSAARLAELERLIGRALPADYIDFMAATDGLEIALFEIFSIDLQGFDAEHGFLTLADWGNGDSDCLVVSGDRFPLGSVVFCNHNPDDAAIITDSFGAWVRGIMAETRQLGSVGHPRDYMHQLKRAEGLYAHIPDAMRGLDCELNR
jgi:hypothetical protein